MIIMSQKKDKRDTDYDTGYPSPKIESFKHWHLFSNYNSATNNNNSANNNNYYLANENSKSVNNSGNDNNSTTNNDNSSTKTMTLKLETILPTEMQRRETNKK